MKDCGIVKDLLPLYAEDMASEETAAFVKTHLETCEDCRKAYEEMKAPVEADPAAPLKTVKKAVKKRGLLIAGLIACLVAALLVGAFARLTKPIPVTSSEEAFELISTKRKRVGIADGVDVVLENVTAGDPAFSLDVPDDENIAETVTATISIETEDTITFTIHSTDPGIYYAHLNADDQTAAEPAILGIPERLMLTANPTVREISIEKTGREAFVGAYTSLWYEWTGKNGEPAHAEIDLTDVDVVYFEPFNNTEHETLYVREGYTPESGFALPRLVMNYYFLMALAGTIVLAVVWFVLRLLKKQKASRVFGVLLLIAASGVLAFLFAGFPATTIAPARELAFVCVIALLLIGAGLSARALLKKE